MGYSDLARSPLQYSKSLAATAILEESLKFAIVKVKNKRKRGKMKTGTDFGLIPPSTAQADSRI